MPKLTKNIIFLFHVGVALRVKSVSFSLLSASKGAFGKHPPLTLSESHATWNRSFVCRVKRVLELLLLGLCLSMSLMCMNLANHDLFLQTEVQDYVRGGQCRI
jgi:hypothetical protein